MRDTVESAGRRAHQRGDGEAALGRRGRRRQAVQDRARVGDGAWLTVVGVFKDVRQSGLDDEPGPWFMRPYSAGGLAGDEHRHQDGVGAGVVRRAGEERARDGRTQSAGLVGRQDDGGDRRPLDLRPALPDAAAERLRRARTRARRDRHCRCRRLLGRAADAGDRPAHGARRATARRAAPHPRASRSRGRSAASSLAWPPRSACCGSSTRCCMASPPRTLVSSVRPPGS